MKKTYFFTFGQAHKDRAGNSLANCYTTIEAEHRDEARQIMFSRYGRQWAFQYQSAETAGVYKYNLKHIDFEELSVRGPEESDDHINLFNPKS